MTLDEAAAFIKSANAGPTYLTFDVGFADHGSYDRVRLSGALTPQTIAALYPVSQEDVQIYHYDPALVIKITIPRGGQSGGPDERDFDGVQQFAPLLSIQVPEEPAR